MYLRTATKTFCSFLSTAFLKMALLGEGWSRYFNSPFGKAKHTNLIRVAEAVSDPQLESRSALAKTFLRSLGRAIRVGCLVVSALIFKILIALSVLVAGNSVPVRNEMPRCCHHGACGPFEQRGRWWWYRLSCFRKSFFHGLKPRVRSTNLNTSYSLFPSSPVLYQEGICDGPPIRPAVTSAGIFR